MKGKPTAPINPASSYTALWLEDFDQESVLAYDQKFKRRWEKNIKHRQQVDFVRKYLKDWMFWCDCPIGSGRLMRELSSQRMLGFDISPAFLRHNQSLGIQCVAGDLLSLPFDDQFDLVTSLHTVFAFHSFREILLEYIHSLKPGGILIVDILNKVHIQETQGIAKIALQGNEYGFPEGMEAQEIEAFFAGAGCDVLEITLHDFWDNYNILAWRHDPARAARFFKKRVWWLLNRLYFWFDLRAFLERFQEGKPDECFTKYLVAVRKR